MHDPHAPTLCVIPARGGSKGIPGKNLVNVAGKPLLVWTIEAALAADAPLNVLVSTDDQRIAEVALAAGASVPFIRPTELAQDTTATEPVVEHAIAHLHDRGAPPAQVLLLQATSPVRLPGTIDAAIQLFSSSGADSLVAVVPQAPFLWWLTRDGHGPIADYPVAARPRRQDLTPHTLRYRETGSLYLTKTEVYTEEHNRLGGRIVLFQLDEVEVGDIDTPVDLAVTEQLLLSQRAAPPDVNPPLG